MAGEFSSENVMTQSDLGLLDFGFLQKFTKKTKEYRPLDFSVSNIIKDYKGSLGRFYLHLTITLLSFSIK